MADTAAMKLAEILGEPTDAILALVAADRTSDPAAKKQWTNMAKKLRATAAATTMAARIYDVSERPRPLSGKQRLRTVCILC